jgi:hypothetical protein
MDGWWCGVFQCVVVVWTVETVTGSSLASAPAADAPIGGEVGMILLRCARLAVSMMA